MGGKGSGPRPKHGATDTIEYKIWDAIKQRCNNPKAWAYQWYGARGITMDERWNDFENFLADMGPRPSGQIGKRSAYSIDRRDNNKGYGPDNCYWATRGEQYSSRRPRRRTVNLLMENVGQ